jgi:hypothetical protein
LPATFLNGFIVVFRLLELTLAFKKLLTVSFEKLFGVPLKPFIVCNAVVPKLSSSALLILVRAKEESQNKMPTSKYNYERNCEKSDWRK